MKSSDGGRGGLSCPIQVRSACCFFFKHLNRQVSWLSSLSRNDLKYSTGGKKIKQRQETIISFFAETTGANRVQRSRHASLWPLFTGLIYIVRSKEEHFVFDCFRNFARSPKNEIEKKLLSLTVFKFGNTCRSGAKPWTFRNAAGPCNPLLKIKNACNRALGSTLPFLTTLSQTRLFFLDPIKQGDPLRPYIFDSVSKLKLCWWQDWWQEKLSRYHWWRGVKRLIKR